MPRYFDVRTTVLLVVGYGILAEEEDRPIAYDLKRAIGSRSEGADNRSAVVVTDMWMLNQEMAEMFPAVAIGGPAVNAFTAQIYEDLPIAFTRDQRVFIQMNQDRGKRAALWGMDQRTTREAADAVREGRAARPIPRARLAATRLIRRRSATRRGREHAGSAGPHPLLRRPPGFGASRAGSMPPLGRLRGPTARLRGRRAVWRVCGSWRRGGSRSSAMSPEGREQVLHVEGSGATLGEVPLFDRAGYVASAAAQTAARLLWLPRRELDALSRRHPESGSWP